MADEADEADRVLADLMRRILNDPLGYVFAGDHPLGPRLTLDLTVGVTQVELDVLKVASDG